MAARDGVRSRATAAGVTPKTRLYHVHANMQVEKEMKVENSLTCSSTKIPPNEVSGATPHDSPVWSSNFELGEQAACAIPTSARHNKRFPVITQAV
jgi:hypothetical protein